MRYWSLIFSRLPAQAMALYPFMLFKSEQLRNDDAIIRHEQIHFRQQLELLIVAFYVLYFLHYLMNLVRYGSHKKAYFNICFEKEAYKNDADPDYLKKRRPYAWLLNYHNASSIT